MNLVLSFAGFDVNARMRQEMNWNKIKLSASLKTE
jgi:hypothetical protein